MQFATTPNWTTTAPAVRMTIQGGGNVGIGTTAPWAKLHVNGPYGDPSLSSSTTAIAAFHSDTSVQLLMGGYQTAPYGFWLQTNNNNGGSAYPILLNPIAGGAGVGTTNPTAQFHTTGSVRFEGLPGGTLVTDASGNVSAVAGGGGGGDKHYYFDTGMYVGHTNSAGGPDAVDLTAQIAAAGLNIPGVTVKAALIRSYTRLGPLPAGGYTASATTWCWGSVAGLDYGVVSGVLVNGGGAAVDSGFGICPLFDGHTLYWKREVLVNATAEDHGIILQGFVYTQ
jgi:hypothetical protein